MIGAEASTSDDVTEDMNKRLGEPRGAVAFRQ